MDVRVVACQVSVVFWDTVYLTGRLIAHTQPFNGLWSGTTRVGRYQKKHSPTHMPSWKSSGFCGAGEDNGGRGTDSPGGRQPIRTNGAPTPITPPFFIAGCPSCRNPPNLSWLGTGTESCWVAYPMACFTYPVAWLTCLSASSTNSAWWWANTRTALTVCLKHSPSQSAVICLNWQTRSPNSPDLNSVDNSVWQHCNRLRTVTDLHTLISWNACWWIVRLS